MSPASKSPAPKKAPAKRVSAPKKAAPEAKTSVAGVSAPEAAASAIREIGWDPEAKVITDADGAEIIETHLADFGRLPALGAEQLAALGLPEQADIRLVPILEF